MTFGMNADGVCIRLKNYKLGSIHGTFFADIIAKTNRGAKMNSMGIIERHHKITLYLALIIFLAGSPLFAAPSISGVSGTVANGNSITISGSNFGSGPTVALFDDFESGTNGANVSGSSTCKVGSYLAHEYGASWPTYTNAGSISGSLSMQVNHWNAPTGTQCVAVGINNQYVFVSMWTKAPGGLTTPNWKWSWLFQSSGETGNDDIDFVYVNSEWYASANVGSYNGSNEIKNVGLTVDSGNWTRVWYYFNATTSSSGRLEMWQLGSGGVSQLINDTRATWSSNNIDHLRVDGYAQINSEQAYPEIDDLYVATGANAMARVEIGNNATYTSCTNLTMCTPDSWSASSITAHVWRGSFGSSASAYLFVIDSNGNVSPGYPIQFGSGSGGGGTTDTTPPPTPTGVTVTILQ